MSPAAATPLATAPPPGRTGFFGKLPGRGDFVRRDLPNAFVEDWDAWVQRGMAASRAALGAGWLDVWLCAPIWRFAFVAGVCGPDAWAGVL
ncbi:MAG: type VI secretion system-associated protein TagF, partial [Rhodospirillales bacterium]|nr:type VI secretion system-associated protein TagF [Rhodospirillales bacterium]